MPGLRRHLVLTAAGLSMAASPALAWGPAQTVSSAGGEGRSPAVAMNRAGVAAMAWVQGPWARRAVIVAVRDADGRWSEPVRVSPRGRAAIDPSVAVDAAGRATVVWRQAIGSQRIRVGSRTVRRVIWVVRARTRASGGAWGDVVTLSQGRLKVGAPQVGIDSSGTAVAAWHWGTGSPPRLTGFVGQVQAAIMRNGTWSRLRRVSGVSGCSEERRPRVAVGPRGDAVVWWQCDLRGGSTAFAVTRRPDDTRWSSPTELPFRTRGDQRADLDVAFDGAVTAVSAARGGAIRWWRGAVTGDRLSLSALPRPSTVERVDDAGGGPDIDVDASGDALSAWVAPGGRGAVKAAPVAALLGAGSPTTLIGGEPVRNVRVRAGDGRRGTVAWVERAGTARAAVLAAVRDGNGAWSSPSRLSARGGVVLSSSPRLAGRGGMAIVAWERVMPGGDRVVQRAEYPAS
jgi:hypothetical protein